MSDTTKKPSNAPEHPRTLEKQALERALQQAKPRTGYPYDWLDYEDYKSDTHSHSSVAQMKRATRIQTNPQTKESRVDRDITHRLTDTRTVFLHLHRIRSVLISIR